MDMIIPPASRLSEVGEYYFSKKLEEVRRLKDTGANVINLGIGSPDLSPSETTIAATVESLNSSTSHGYPTSRATPVLRNAIAKWYGDVYKVSLNPEENILPLLGSKEGIMFISMAFLNPGDGVLIPNPGYAPYGNVAKLIGARPVLYDLKEENSWEPDFEELQNKIKDVKLMWVNYPNMPTGQRAKSELFERLVQFGKKNNILICNDNPYSLVLNPAPLSILKFDPTFECCLEMNSLSKAFNMPGWRVGMALSRKSVINAILQVKSNVDSGMFLPIQAGAVAALSNSAKWHEARNNTYLDRREIVFAIFDHLGFRYKKDQVGLFVWAKAPENIKDLPAFLDKILYEAHVFIVPGFIFGTNGKSYARSSLCQPVDVLKDALNRISKMKWSS
jgi:LL-diaminopimelate aminotransferase